jgi:oxalate decarboxylase/phosphoglucose isomerase-like protein (cupin superfamily)
MVIPQIPCCSILITATRTTFMVDDWIAHTPKDILAKNFGVDSSVFSTVPATDPYIVKGNGNVSTIPAKSPYGALTGNSSYVYYGSQQPATNAPGGGGTIQIVDSRNFPIATTIAAAIVTVEPKGLRELHWHPTVSIRSTYIKL